MVNGGKQRCPGRAPAVVILLAIAVLVPTASAQSDEVSLTLKQSLKTALQNNFDLVSARMDPEISEQNVLVQKAGFDPNLGANGSHFESKQEISNLFSLNQSERDRADVGVDQLLNFGADYKVSLIGRRNIDDGPQVVTPTTYLADLAMEFNMPLLKGRGKKVTTEQLQLARGNLEISLDQLEIEAQRVLQEAENAYWDLVAAREGVRLAELRLTRAGDLLELNRKKVEVGTLAPIEITQAEAEVASQQEGVIVAEVDMLNAEDALRRLLAIPQDDVMWAQTLIPTDRPEFTERTVFLNDAIATAMAERPERRRAQQAVRNRALSEKVAKRNVSSALDFQAAYTPQGNNFETVFDAAGNPVGQVSDGKLLEALREIPDNSNYSWSVGLNFRYPIGNKAAKANYAIASLDRQKADVDLMNQDQTIRVEVRRAARGVESGVKRVNAARTNSRLQREKLDAEQKKFENGMSTSFEVLTFQNDLGAAELREVQAILDYLKSLVELERSKGTLLESRGLSLAK